MNEPWVIIALLGAVIFLYAFIQFKGQKARAAQHSPVSDMEEAFEQFAHDIEDDNRKVMEHVASLKASYEQKITILTERIDQHNLFFSQRVEQLEQQIKVMEQLIQDSKQERQELLQTNKAPRLDEVIEVIPEQVIDENDSIRDRYQSIFEMYHDGKSIEYIAKRLGMNKGEVQLVLTLSQQEEAIRAQG